MNTFAVKRLVKTVNHSAPREATADMMFTRNPLPLALTTRVRPFGAQERPGGESPILTSSRTAARVHGGPPISSSSGVWSAIA
ncbi:hypothetical protein ABT186_22220 [Streptomyces sp. NPDC001634]|uniref:hypothetical protein n=1 Tax=Streptomyces sp. NPDC001634 TaxID=3154390 RepID=UPI003316E6B9